MIPSTSTLTAVSTGAAHRVRDRSPVAGAPVVMAALWQSLGRRCHDRLIYPSAVRIRRALVLLTLVACGALSACGGDDDDKSDDATPGASASSDPTEATSGPATVDLPSEACDLLSAEDVSDLVGTKVKEGIPTSGPDHQRR